MTFLAPWFLIGILAAAIPLLLHLRRSRQTRPILFSCTRFFDEQFLKATRRAKIQDLVLMAVRMALLAILALALAQPLLRSGPLVSLLNTAAARHVVIVLDDSTSMGGAGQRGSLFDDAQSKALAIAAELSTARGDTASVVMGGLREAGPTVLFDQPTSDLDAVRRAIDMATLTDLATDLDGAIARARDVLGTASGGEIIVISDMQAEGFAPDHIASPGPTASLVLVACRPDTAAANASVDAVQLGAARPMVGVPFTFRAMITNHGNVPLDHRVQLTIGSDIVATRSIELPPNRGQIVRFVHRFTQPGWHAGRVELDPSQASDALAVDNQRHFAVHVEQRLRVLAINGAASTIPHQNELYFLRAALAVGRTDEHGIQVDEITADRISTESVSGYPVVILANVGAFGDAAQQTLARYVDAGGSVFITVGDRSDAAWLSRWTTFVPATFADAPTAADRANTIGAIDDAHPALAGLSSLSAARLDRWLTATPIDAAVLMATGDNQPLLLERRLGAGRVMLWTSTIDRDWNDLPLQPAFLPWLYRVMAYLAQPAIDGGTFILTGDTAALPVSVWSDAALQVKLPDGGTAYPAPSASRGVVLDDTARAGVYTIVDPRKSASESAVLMLAANVDHAESRLQTLSEADIRTRMPPDAMWAFVPPEADVADAGLQSARGQGVWDALLVLALIVAIGEPWLASYLSKRRNAAAGTIGNVRGMPLRPSASARTAA